MHTVLPSTSPSYPSSYPPLHLSYHEPGCRCRNNWEYSVGGGYCDLQQVHHRGGRLRLHGLLVLPPLRLHLDGKLSPLLPPHPSQGTHVMLGARVFAYKPAPLSGVFPLAMGSLLSVAFMNLNLSHNSVGFYQLSKLACIPCTLLVQYLAYSQTISRRVMLTLIPITLGVGYATVYDLEINFLGFVFATAAVVATSFAQIFTNTYQVPPPS